MYTLYIDLLWNKKIIKKKLVLVTVVFIKVVPLKTYLQDIFS